MPLQSATYTFEDLSGPPLNSQPDDPNPYKGLIEACNNNSAQIQARYNAHRTARTNQQRALLLSSDFSGINIDPILVGLIREEAKRKYRHPTSCVVLNGSQKEHPGQQNEEFVDHRHNLSFWARPPRNVRELVGECQKRLKAVVPELWLMPLEKLHMTTLEIFDSRDAAAVTATRATLGSLIPEAVNLPYTLHAATPNEESRDTVITNIRAFTPFPGGIKRARLVNPFLVYDAAATALTWLPATSQDLDEYTYHHLRRDMWELLSETSIINTTIASEGGDKVRRPVPVKSRYVVPSAHLTITRNISRWDAKLEQAEAGCKPDRPENYDEAAVDHEKVKAFVGAIDEINAWLKSTFWQDPTASCEANTSMQWIIGEEKGLDFRCGTSWYGDGESIDVGKAF